MIAKEALKVIMDIKSLSSGISKMIANGFQAIWKRPSDFRILVLSQTVGSYFTFFHDTCLLFSAHTNTSIWYKCNF